MPNKMANQIGYRCQTKGLVKPYSGGKWATQGVNGPLRECICHSGDVYRPLRGVYRPIRDVYRQLWGVYGPLRGYMGHSGDVYGPLRGCIWATQGMYIVYATQVMYICHSLGSMGHSKI